MSRSRQIPHAEAENRSIPRRRTVPNEEEYRLLGGSVKDDPEAISIPKPATRHSAMFSKIVSGGPQPRNTLSRDSFTFGPAPNRKAAPNPRIIQHALAVEVHKGSNVNVASSANERDEVLPTPPSAKRRKLDHQVSPASSDKTDPLDQISPHAMSFHASQATSRSPSRAPSASANSRASVLPLKRNGSFEFRTVEKMMDSRPPKSKKQCQNDNRNHRPDHVLLPSSPPKRSSMSNPIEISGDDSQLTTTTSKEAPRPGYRGTARQPPQTIHGIQSNTSISIKDQAHATQSPYFDKYRFSTTQANGIVKQKSSTQNLDKENSPGLARKFVAVDGTRRGSDVNASSDGDELQSAPTTVGQNADPDAVFTVKEMRSKSPSKQSSLTLKASTPTDDLAVLAPSTIKSDFANSNAKNQNPGRPAPRNQEAKPPWSVALAAISLPGGVFQKDDLGLVHDRKQGDYYIQWQGQAIKSTHSSLRIQPRKLRKVLWEMSGTRVRLESSRSGMEDNVLDIQLTCEHDVLALLRQLQVSYNLSVTGRKSEYMQKIFEKRKSELRNLDGTPKGYRPEIIETVAHNEEPNASSSYLSPLDPEKTTRLRQKRSIVDELVHSATHDTGMAAARPKMRMPAMPNGLPEEKSIKGILAKVKPTHNEHLNLRRSTRNSGVHDGESLLSSLDGIPQKEKYSVKHGLGEPWKKPLTYPKVGKKKTTVEWSDLERLDEGEFLNDNLISFYLRYLEQRLEEERPELAKRVYFFNTFFFATLTSAHKGRKRFNYEGVQKWTRSVDLFTYDYIIVPINEQAHWYLAIVCNLPALNHDLAMHEDGATSSIEDGGATSKRKSCQSKERASSPTSQPDVNEASPNPQEPNERETRDSFSQLSLDNDTRLPAGDEVRLDEPNPGKLPPNSEDKEMLDSQIEDTMPDFAASKVAKDHPALAKEEDEEVDDPIEDHGESPKATAKSRKSKRKSLPAPITKIDPRKPAIITFDSLGQPRSQTIRILKDYLREEAKAKRGMEFEESQIKGINAKRIPQQDNYSDCGVFLLGYVDTFLGLETDPKDFITKTIQQTHGEKDWSKLVPGHLRASIRNQVLELHEIQKNERREESARKSGQNVNKDDMKPEPSPSRAPDQGKIDQKRPGEANGADDFAATTSKAPDSLFDGPRTSDETLETGRQWEEEDENSDKHDGWLNECLRANEQAMQKEAELHRLYNPDDAEQGVDDGEAPAFSRDDPSVILVDSQSQQRMSAPTGVSYPSFSSGKQSYPESTSSRVVNPTPLPFEKEKSHELPSEIPDSQNSKVSQKVAENRPTTNTDPAPVPENLSTTSDSNQRLPGWQGERHERSKRRKTGREHRVDVQEAPEEQEMVFAIEKSPERRTEPLKESSKRRKRSAKEASKDFEEVQIHVIDD